VGSSNKAPAYAGREGDSKVADEKLRFPLPEDTLGEVVHLFPTMTSVDPRYTVEVGHDEACCHCGALRKGHDDPVVIMFDTAGQAIRMYCGGECLVAWVTGLVKPKQEVGT
jgi:hypothetical protein